ncbi:MAG: hypothetical protein M0027_08750 [Candidatus Dormibacteraeota bacterium]|nr:hypothetical protein [Candidatus Dormibacteraeota bacterium]
MTPGTLGSVAGGGQEPAFPTGPFAEQGQVGRPGAGIANAEVLTSPPGDSAVQRDAETEMLAALGTDLGAQFTSYRIRLVDGGQVEVDGFSEDPPILVEAWAHQGPPKGGQRNKVLADALKLRLAAGLFDPRPRLILCFADEDAARPFRPSARTWYAKALRDAGVDVLVVKLTEERRAQIREAQTRQYR